MFRRQHVERDVDDHVFLPAHHLAPAELDEDRAGVEPMVGGGGDEDFERGVARPCPHPGKAGIDADRAILHRDDAVRDAEAKVVVGVNAALGLRRPDTVIGRKPRRILIHPSGSLSAI